jgi:hypothetical protein
MDRRKLWLRGLPSTGEIAIWNDLKYNDLNKKCQEMAM